MRQAATLTAASGAGHLCAPWGCPAPLPSSGSGPVLWTVLYVERRNGAAAFLGAQREQGAHNDALPYWRAPGFVSLFDDAQMMDWARQRGWRHDR